MDVTPAAFNANLLDGVMDVTTPPNETPAAAGRRCASILEMFRVFDPDDAVQAMIACHCITLEFMLRGAMRDACDTSQDPKTLVRMRASAVSISKTLLTWMTKYDAMKARAEARAAETPSTPALVAPAPEARPEAVLPSLEPREEAPAPIIHPGLAALAAKEALVTAAKSNGHAAPPGR